MPFLVTPSIAPNYNNNPSYTTLKISDFTIKDLKINSYQLHQHILFNTHTWVELDPLADYKIDLNDGRGTIDYLFIDPVEYGKFIGYEFGFDKYTREVIIGNVMVPIQMKFGYQLLAIKDSCSLINYFEDSYD